MFELETTTAKLIHINPRTEKHGDQDVPAADLKVQVIDGNGILSHFHPTLRSFLYEQDTSEGQIEGTESLTQRRFGSLIERLRLDHKLVGASVTIGFGLGGGFGYRSRYGRCGRLCGGTDGGRQREPDISRQGDAHRRADKKPISGAWRRNRYYRHATRRAAGIAARRLV